MIKTDSYGRATTQLHQIADEYKVEDERDIYVMKIPESYKQKLLATWLRVKLYTYERAINTYWLPPSAWKKIFKDETEIEYGMKFSELKDYQQWIIKEIRQDNLRAGFVVSGTGTGKSYILSGLIAMNRKKTLILVPNISIARWLLEKLSQWTSSIYLAQWAKVKWAEEHDIVICHHTTFNKHYDYINGKYDVLIIDEWHHLPKKRIEQINKRKWWAIYWLSATPIRKEFSESGVEKIFGKIYDTWIEALPVKVLIHKFRYNYDMEELDQASQWLAPDSIEIFRRLIIANEKRYDELLKILSQLSVAWYKKYIIFSDRVEHIEKTMKLLADAWYNTIWYYWASNKDEADKQIKASDEYVIVWHPTSCWEWFDVPDLEVSILFTSTGWEWAIKQMAGRARRYAGDKKEWILVDFVDQISIMGGKSKSLSFWKRMKVYKQLDWETTAL